MVLVRRRMCLLPDRELQPVPQSQRVMGACDGAFTRFVTARPNRITFPKTSPRARCADRAICVAYNGLVEKTATMKPGDRVDPGTGANRHHGAAGDTAARCQRHRRTGHGSRPPPHGSRWGHQDHPTFYRKTRSNTLSRSAMALAPGGGLHRS